MRTVILGGTGFIGGALSGLLVEQGHEVVIPSRDPERHANRRGDKVVLKAWDARDPQALARLFEQADAVVNLVGESIAARNWSEEQKTRIRDSRLRVGEAVVEAFRLAESKPAVLVQASAVGYYGPRGDELLDEDSEPGEGFLAEVASAWERSTAAVEDMGVRRPIARTGMVLGRRGGALEKFVTPFRFFVGGPLGSGRQWISWIHLQDEIGAIRHLLLTEGLSGPFNLCAPNPLTMADFAQAIGRAMRRPSWLPAPAFALKALMGQMAEELILSGQRVLPRRLLAAGYKFHYPEAGQALTDLLAD